jgi:DNA replication protein DnaC
MEGGSRGKRHIYEIATTWSTLADGILDRLVHNAHRIEMGGDSMRKSRGKTGG